MYSVPRRDVKKSMTLAANYGLGLLLQFLCLILPYCENASQIWYAISNYAVFAYAETKLALMQQEDLIVLTHLLRLLSICLLMQLVNLALIGTIFLTCILNATLYLCNFFFLRHRRQIWTATTITLRLTMTIIYAML